MLDDKPATQEKATTLEEKWLETRRKIKPIKHEKNPDQTVKIAPGHTKASLPNLDQIENPTSNG